MRPVVAPAHTAYGYDITMMGSDRYRLAAVAVADAVGEAVAVAVVVNVAVAELVGVRVGVRVGVAVTAPALQKPPISVKPPPPARPASACPLTPLST